MKKFTTTLLFLTLGSTFYFAQVGVNTSNPQSTFDIAAKTTDGSKPEGVIAPRLTGDQIKSADTKYDTAQKGLIIYALSAVGTPSTKTANITAEGYYYFNGTAWQKLSNPYKGTASVAITPDNSLIRTKLEGDVDAAANYNVVTVTGLQGRTVSPTPPVPDNLLYYNGSNWAPRSIASLNIPRQVLSVSVVPYGTNQNLKNSAGTTGYELAFPVPNVDTFGAWTQGLYFTVPANMGGTYTVNMQTSNRHTNTGAAALPWFVIAELQKTNDGVNWFRLISDVRSGLDPNDIDNGNVIFWTGVLNAGERLRIVGKYDGNTDNVIQLANLAITKL